jgi:hypothetical protein
MLKIPLTIQQFDFFTDGLRFGEKALCFLKCVYVDRVSIKDSSDIAGFSNVRGYQLSGQFAEIINKKLKESGKKITVTIQ